MKSRLIEHIASILVVTCAFAILLVVLQRREAERQSARRTPLEQYLQLDFLDLSNPLHAALFKETLSAFHPGTPARNDSLLQELQHFRQEQFSSQAYKTGGEERGLSTGKFMRLGSMYARFIIIYVIVLILTYHAARSLAIFRFVKIKQHRVSYLAEMYRVLREFPNGQRGTSRSSRMSLLFLKALGRGMAYVVLFAPAYVIAYSLRTIVDTNSFLFLILLAVVSNGLLVNYANRFFTLLMSESRKGYVETAIVKNLNASYEWSSGDGIPYPAVVRPHLLSSSHAFSHIYVNARHQFITTLKEHASFQITGLIIIEMALNIQGHLGYELLQNVLYKNYDVVVTIILGIFLIVKMTEIVVDSWFHRESGKYENRG